MIVPISTFFRKASALSPCSEAVNHFIQKKGNPITEALVNKLFQLISIDVQVSSLYLAMIFFSFVLTFSTGIQFTADFTAKSGINWKK
jgi:hypothetical protein